jgi:hypothetical protein
VINLIGLREGANKENPLDLKINSRKGVIYDVYNKLLSNEVINHSEDHPDTDHIE